MRPNIGEIQLRYMRENGWERLDRPLLGVVPDWREPFKMLIKYPHVTRCQRVDGELGGSGVVPILHAGAELDRETPDCFSQSLDRDFTSIVWRGTWTCERVGKF